MARIPDKIAKIKLVNKIRSSQKEAKGISTFIVDFDQRLQTKHEWRVESKKGVKIKSI